MSDYRRYFVSGGMHFFPPVTERRTALFADAAARRLPGSVFGRWALRRAVRVLATALPPDHLHCLSTFAAGGQRLFGAMALPQERIHVLVADAR